MRRPGCVYRAFDLGGTLLYVGSSVSPYVRLADHEKSAPWWPFKADVTMQWFDDIREARIAELEAIHAEHPRWNIVGRDPEHPDGHIGQAYGRFNAPHLREEIDIWRQWKANQTILARALDVQARLQEQIDEIAGDRCPTAPPLSAVARKRQALRDLQAGAAS